MKPPISALLILVLVATFSGCVSEVPAETASRGPWLVAEGVCLGEPSWIGECIETDHTLTIRDLTLSGAGDLALFILPRHKDVLIDGFRISGYDQSILLDRIECECSITLRNGTIEVPGPGKGMAAVWGYTASGMGGDSVELDRVRIAGHDRAVHLEDWKTVVVSDVTVPHCITDGIEVLDSDARITNLTAVGCAEAGLRAAGDGSVKIRDGTFSGSHVGINLSNIQTASIMDTEVIDNEMGVRFTGKSLTATGVRVEQNGKNPDWRACLGVGFCIVRGQATVIDSSIMGNPAYGLYASQGFTDVDARSNWWGDREGPRFGTGDHFLGTSSGDAVSLGVDVYPWRTEPPGSV